MLFDKKKKIYYLFFFSSRRRHTRYWRDWSSDVCSSDLLISDAVQSTAVAPPPRSMNRAKLARYAALTRCLSGRRTAPSAFRRSEERGVGKGGRSRWAPDYLKKKNRDSRCFITYHTIENC